MPASGGASSAGIDQMQSLMIDVRANTQGFTQDLAAMRGSFDTTLVTGFSQAGNTLATGLNAAIAVGTAGFGALRETALGVISDIATQASSNLLGAIGADSGASAGSGLLGLGGLFAAFSGLPGRATGGGVSPGQPYVVGENGPEVFVPTSAGSIVAHRDASSGQRDLQVSISVNTPAGSAAPQALQRSSRQVASAVRRALSQN